METPGLCGGRDSHVGMRTPCTDSWVYVKVNVNNLLAMSEQDFDNSGEPGPQAMGVCAGLPAAALFEICASPLQLHVWDSNPGHQGRILHYVILAL